MSTPYRSITHAPAAQPSLWRRFKCWLDRHEFYGPPREWALGEYLPCAHCTAKLVRMRPPELGGEWFYTIERRPLPEPR
jgi:hypothetical protein